ncbi:MAG TPA: PQQ-binding-like beta-propeller repeat protein [Thermoanaerobaculia bacterium]|jgi:outer membrane protein assembly factor BamB
MLQLRVHVPLALSLALLASAASPADWPQFRGPNRDGISQETDVLKSWPANGPKVLWRVPLGEGYSHLAVVKGRLLTLYGQGDNEYAVALDAATGKPLWRVAIDRKLVNDQGNGPRSTPTVDGDTVYVLSGQGRLAALKLANGQTLWQHDLRAEYGAQPPTWGIATSPLVEGNLLLVNVGGSNGRSMAAFDKANGKPLWFSQNDPAGYAAPIAITVGGVRQVIFFTGDSVVSIAPKDGKLLWRVPWRTDLGVNAATPIFLPPDKLFISSGYDTGAAVFQIRPADAGITVAEVWRNRVMKNQFSSSLLYKGIIYGFDNATFKAIDAATGQERWKQRGFGQGSLILAGGNLIVLSDSGKLALVEATPEQYRELGSATVLSGRCWTAPTLTGSRLYLRNQEELLSLDWRG